MNPRVKLIASIVSAVALVAAGAATYAGINADTTDAAGAGDLAILHETPVHQRKVLETNVTVHFVFVGFDQKLIDEERVLDPFPSSYQPVDRIRSLLWMQRFHEPLRYNLDYEVHHAPWQFSEALFTRANELATWDAAPQFLHDYDDRSGEDRLAGDEEIQYVPVTPLEDWMAENRGAYGLAWDEPSYTVFVLDSWTRGYMPRDTYHYYEYRKDLQYGEYEDVRNLRAWGGNHDFMWIDFSAAPNDASYDTGGTAGSTDQTDPPIWEYDAAGHHPAGFELNSRIAQDLKVGTFLRLVPSNLYHATYQPKYFVNVHLYRERTAVYQNATQPPLEELVDVDEVVKRLSAAIPWAEWDGKLSTYTLPDDDPGMFQAVEQAKAEGAGTYVATGPIKSYVNAHEDRYVAGGPDAYNIKVFYFDFEGHWAFALPVIVAGIASSNPDGAPWGVLGSNDDLINLAGIRTDYNALTSHEVGHFLGLNHPHDGVVRDPDGTYREIVDYTWDQTATPMSYRMMPYDSDNLDRELIARSHTAGNVNDAYDNLRIAGEVLRDEGVSGVPPAVENATLEAMHWAEEAERLFAEGHWWDPAREMDSVRASIRALNASERAIDAAGGLQLTAEVVEWDASGVDHAAAKTSVIDGTWAAAPYYDYREVIVDDRAERVEVTVTWTPTADSKGDFFAGWHYHADPCRYDAVDHFMVEDTTPVNAPVCGADIGGHPGVWDTEQPPVPGQLQVEQFTLDLDDDGIREDGRIWVGAGSLKDVENGEYHVKVRILKRDGAKT